MFFKPYKMQMFAESMLLQVVCMLLSLNVYNFLLHTSVIGVACMSRHIIISVLPPNNWNGPSLKAQYLESVMLSDISLAICDTPHKHVIGKMELSIISYMIPAVRSGAGGGPVKRHRDQTAHKGSWLGQNVLGAWSELTHPNTPQHNIVAHVMNVLCH